MTAEQLEELLGKVVKLKAAETYEKIMNMFPGPPIVEYLCRENAHLTRRVICAEKLTKAARILSKDLQNRAREIAQALFAYASSDISNIINELLGDPSND